jgi:hypothetical protein
LLDWTGNNKATKNHRGHTVVRKRNFLNGEIVLDGIHDVTDEGKLIKCGDARNR